MALTSKKISVKNIIAKVYQDLDLTEEEDIGRIIEWSAEALGKINVYNQLDFISNECIHINNYKAEIPCNLVYLDDINYNNSQIVKASGGSNVNRVTDYPYYLTPQSVNKDKIINATYIYGMQYRFTNGANFIMDDGYFKTSFKEGDIEISYRAFSVDKDGFMEIPDNESFRDAVFWYIAYKYFYIKAIKDKDFWRFYQDAEYKYKYYINQAGAEALMPDLATLENIKRNYLQLIPKVNSYEVFFSDLNQPSNSYNSNAK